MSIMRFLLDKCVPSFLAQHLAGQEPMLDVIFVGGGAAPPKGTLDPDLLMFAESSGRAIITKDRNTMPGHAANHVASGRHTWGVFLLRPDFAVPDYANSIILLWAASEAEEWIDSIEWIPF
jgi:hypothetical protein